MDEEIKRASLAGSHVVHDSTTVHVRGEDLHTVLWQGRQWAVTTYGVECRDGTYSFEASRLCEDHSEGLSWIKHMAGKRWVDIADFATAFYVAVALHGVKLTRKEVVMLAKHYRAAL
jgi:hypothetical protein